MMVETKYILDKYEDGIDLFYNDRLDANKIASGQAESIARFLEMLVNILNSMKNNDSIELTVKSEI